MSNDLSDMDLPHALRRICTRCALLILFRGTSSPTTCALRYRHQERTEVIVSILGLRKFFMVRPTLLAIYSIHIVRDHVLWDDVQLRILPWIMRATGIGIRYTFTMTCRFANGLPYALAYFARNRKREWNLSVFLMWYIILGKC